MNQSPPLCMALCVFYRMVTFDVHVVVIPPVWRYDYHSGVTPSQDVFSDQSVTPVGHVTIVLAPPQGSDSCRRGVLLPGAREAAGDVWPGTPPRQGGENPLPPPPPTSSC